MFDFSYLIPSPSQVHLLLVTYALYFGIKWFIGWRSEVEYKNKQNN